MMAKSTREERLKAKLAAKEALEAEVRALAGRIKADTVKKLRREAFIIGSALLAEMQDNPDFLRTLQPVLDARVTRPAERRDISHMLPPAPVAPDHISSGSADSDIAPLDEAV
jgi:hypothetical protein